MPDDLPADRFTYYDDILRRLTAMLQAQHEMNERQVALNEQQAEFNAAIRTTLARIETLLARILPPGENGREA
jgi:hypothetical protein